MKKILSSTILLLSTLSWVNAQQTPGAAGGEATGAGGKVSYTAGQTVYTTQNGSAGTITQGVQQPYEIFVVTGVKETQVSLSAAVYPNPAADFILLQIDAKQVAFTSYVLTDMQGKTIVTRKVKDASTKIDLTALAAGAYFIKVLNADKEIKVFKLIKN